VANLMTAFGMFYRLLAAEARVLLDSSSLYPLPRVSAEVRDAIVDRIDRTDGETFAREAIDNLEATIPNSCRWRTAMRRAARLWPDDAGFALLHEALLIQSTAIGRADTDGRCTGSRRRRI